MSRRLWVLCGWAWATTGHAAGGHFAVDDAAILEVGQCQVETWVEREGAARSLVHVGPACRVGPVELGWNVDRSQWRAHAPETTAGPQVKWVHAVADETSVGVVALAGWQGHAPRYATATLYAPLTVQAFPGLWLHANLGRDWFAGRSSSSRAGLAIEWQASPAWTVLGERFRQSSESVRRIGARWQASEPVSIDLSRAIGVGSASQGWWTLGVNWTFDVGQAARQRR